MKEPQKASIYQWCERLGEAPVNQKGTTKKKAHRFNVREALPWQWQSIMPFVLLSNLGCGGNSNQEHQDPECFEFNDWGNLPPQKERKICRFKIFPATTGGGGGGVPMVPTYVFPVHFLVYINDTFDGGIHAGQYTSSCLVATWNQIKRADNTGNTNDGERQVEQQLSSLFWCC